MKRKAFTLVELMVVITVIAILMATAFKLAGMGGDQSRRSTTVKRIQCMHNALSGYYAAFGSYPPVKLHAAQNIYLKIENGQQDLDGATIGSVKWANVKAALMAQPVAAAWPFPTSDEGRIKRISEELRRKASSSDRAYREFAKRQALRDGFTALTSPNAQLGGKLKESVDFNEAPIFRFGLMSYLLPRYLFMTKGDPELYGLPQWEYNNDVQKRAYGNGRDAYSWLDMRRDVLNGNSGLVAMLPSQSVCARWMPNLRDIVHGGKTFFGIDTSVGGSPVNDNNPYITLYCPTKNRAQQYVLDSATVEDGWQRELYYFSPQPYQDYRLWSAGANGRTFAPWVDLSTLDSATRAEVAAWMADDIE